MEDHSSPPREGDSASVPILITDSPEESPNDLLGTVQRSPFKTVGDRGLKDSFRLMNTWKQFFGFWALYLYLYRKLIEELSDQSDLSDDDDSAPANLVTGVSVEADVSAEPFQF